MNTFEIARATFKHDGETVWCVCQDGEVVCASKDFTKCLEWIKGKYERVYVVPKDDKEG